MDDNADFLANILRLINNDVDLPNSDWDTFLDQLSKFESGNGPDYQNPASNSFQSLSDAVSGEGGGNSLGLHGDEGTLRKLTDPRKYIQNLRFLTQAPHLLLNADSNLGEMASRVMLNNMQYTSPELVQFITSTPRTPKQYD